MTLAEMAYDFSVRVAECVKYLKDNNKHFPLTDKLLDCGLMAGIAVRDGKRGEAAGYVARADYMLEMAARSGYMTATQARQIRADAQKLLDELRKTVNQ